MQMRKGIVETKSVNSRSVRTNYEWCGKGTEDELLYAKGLVPSTVPLCKTLAPFSYNNFAILVPFKPSLNAETPASSLETHDIVY